jgi:RNA polymerase sigma-70 factor (ECF subfamily)
MKPDPHSSRAPEDSGVRLTDSPESGHSEEVANGAVLLSLPRPSLAPFSSLPPPSSENAVQSEAECLSEAGPAPRSIAERIASFRSMYDEHVDFVWRNLRRLGVAVADVEDRTQEVFVIAHRRFDRFEDRGHGPRAWLFQIVIRVASDARRHRRRHPEDSDGGVAELRGWIEAEQPAELARREALGRLDEALSTIDVTRRAVLVLHEIEEMTAPEIGRVLHIPLNTVYSRLRVARTELEQALARLARDPTPDPNAEAGSRPSSLRLKRVHR